MNINKSQLHNINNGRLDDLLDNINGVESYEVVKFDDLANTLAYVAALYVDKLAVELNNADATSSGKLSDKTIALDVQVFNTIYSVEIQTLSYAKFIDEGVSGWANDRGSQYSFKSKGVDPNGPMVKSIKDYLRREGKMAKANFRAITKKETKRKNITDVSTKAAITAAYMIKRQGIEPTHYWQKATKSITDVVAKEFAAALKVDIINNLGK